MENFVSILSFIRNSRRQALAAVNSDLIIRNRVLRKYISRKMAQAQWGKKNLQHCLPLSVNKSLALKALKSGRWTECLIL